MRKKEEKKVKFPLSLSLRSLSSFFTFTIQASTLVYFYIFLTPFFVLLTFYFALFSMLSIHLIARNHFLLLVVLTLWIHKVTSQSAENPAFWQAPRSFNSTSALQDDPSNMRFAISQDFQSVHVGDDNRSQIRVKKIYRLTYITTHFLSVCLF